MNGGEMVSTWTRKPYVRVGVGRLAPLSSRLSVKCYSIRHCGIAARNAGDSDARLVRLAIGSARRRKLRSLSRCTPMRLNSRVVGPKPIGGVATASSVAPVCPTLRATHVDQTVKMFADAGSIPAASILELKT